MAFTVNKAVPEFSLVLSIVLIIISHDAKAIKLGSSLSPTPTKNSSTHWLSPSGIFAFGFRPQSNNTNGFDICIWMLSRPQPTVVWTARNGDAGEPYSPNATAELTKGGFLVHDNHLIRRIIAVSSDDEPYYNSISSNITSAAMLNSGNFVLYGETAGDVVWQSFEYPTDTILGGQNLTTGDVLASSGGSGYRLRMGYDGVLVLYTSNDLISRSEENYYWELNTSRSDYPELCLSASGSLYVLSRSPSQDSGDYGRKRRRLFTTDPYNSYSSTPPEAYTLARSRQENGDAATFVYRATLDTDGIFRLYSHRFSNRGNSSGVVAWSALQDKCEVKGFCGLNSFCASREGNGSRSECLCYPGFDFINASDKNSGCYRRFTEESCVSDGEEEGLPIDLRLRYDIFTILNMTWSGHSYLLKGDMNKELCEKSCLDDCGCWAALYMNNSECRKYRLPVMYGRRNKNLSAIAFFKVVVSNITNHISTSSRKDIKIPVDEKNGLILVLASSLGSVLCLFFFLAIASFVVYRRRVYSYKRLLENANLGLAEDFSLQQFSYNELESATNSFSEELGRGSFGAVYKGTTAGNRAVAVKRLERVVEEGVREFRAEITTIGQTHHRNLVQLVGFCVEGSKRLLVYEFMSNGSLSHFLFKAALRPAWKDRAKFALDVARGLFYLHEECGVHIIHCNLKPQNILLDDTWAAKISDFGFARLIVPNQAKLTSGDEESKGYFAPEWKKNALISVKSDIYSFGIVLFEIVCCRRNIDVKVSSPDQIILSSWVYNCYVSEELMKLVELDDHSNVDMKALERMVKVGLWCVQDDPSLRPIMKNVILMLEGTMDIPIPPNPELPLR